MQPPPRIGFFLATSGHSGFDRAMKNLIPSVAKRGYQVELIKIKNHGPYLDSQESNFKIINLKTKHVYSSFFYLIKYLSKNPPEILLTDKDRVNRTAIIARLISRAKTKLFVRCGTTVSINLSSRGVVDRLIQKNSMKTLYKLANKVLVPAKSVAYDMASYTGLDINHIKCVPSPVVKDDIFTQEFPLPHHPWYLKKSNPIILGAGELCKRKDFETLIKSFKIVLQQIECKLIILGKGRKREGLLRLVKDLEIKNYVDFPGFVSNPYSYMAHSDVFVSSSLWEGSSFVLVEALAVGTPVVSTNCPGGHEEVLNKGKFGKLVPVKDPEKMAEAILETLKNPPDPEFIKLAAKPYTISASTDAYLKAFGLPPYWDRRP